MHSRMFLILWYSILNFCGALPLGFLFCNEKMPITHPSHLLALLLLIHTTTTHAHVRMSGSKQKYAANLLPIRNAPSIGSDGRASVGGPCGGSKKWRPDNQPPEVLYGGKVQVSLQYAAGHESPSNLFVVTMACSSPDESDLVADSAKATILSSAVPDDRGRHKISSSCLYRKRCESN